MKALIKLFCEKLHGNLAPYKEHSKNFVCKNPFKFIEVHSDGNIYPCCPAYTKYYSFGNIFQSDFNEIWNSEAARKFRQSCWSGEYAYCNTDICFFGKCEKSKLTDQYDKRMGIMGIFPKHIKFCHDHSCNVRCITCRDEYHIMSKEETEKHVSMIDTFYLPMVKDAEFVEADGSGEIFASKFNKELFSKISKKYQNIIFIVHSNGVLCNERNCTELFGSTDRLHAANISIHAATEDTYNKIVKGSNFNLVMQNIKWLSELKKTGSLAWLNLYFVVQSLNYHEMKKFLELAISLDAKAHFWEFRPWGTTISQKYDDYAVFKPEHPNYKDMAKLLEDPIFNSPHCAMNGIIKNVRL
jgi:radical SAM protein with 4Fe4S-binding SPASM domain